MKQVRKIYDKAFKEKAVQLSYDSQHIRVRQRVRNNRTTVV